MDVGRRSGHRAELTHGKVTSVLLGSIYLACHNLAPYPGTMTLNGRRKDSFSFVTLTGGMYRKLMWINLKEKEEKLEEVTPGSLHFPREQQREIYVPRRSKAEASRGLKRKISRERGQLTGGSG